MGLTFAAILVVGADSVAVGDIERGVAVKEGTDTVGQGPVVEVVELAVVVVAVGRAGEEKGSAQELALNGTRATTGLQTVGLNKNRKRIY